MTKVSVILTSFNHEKYLQESIESVLDQTFTDFELIIWDDASTDASWATIKSYKDSRTQAYRNDTNRRAIYGINESISRVVKGEYIAIHHSDDAWEPHKLAKQVAFLDQHPEMGAVFTNARIVGERGEPFENKSHIYYSIFDQPNRSRCEWLNRFFYHGNALCHPSILIRKICYEKCGFYRYGFATITDFDMWVRLCLKYEIHVLPEKLVRFRIRDNMANASLGGDDNQIRLQFEQLQVLNNYRDLSNYEEMIEIFPSAQKYDRPGGFDAQFVLAMLALEAAPRKYNELFGLQLLFEALNNPSRARRIKELYDFDVNKFKELSGRHDVFSFLQITTLLAEMEAVRREMQAQLAQKDAALKSLSGHNAELTTLTAEQDRVLEALTAEQDRPLQALTAEKEQIEQQLQELIAQAVELDRHVQALTGPAVELAEIKSSRVWKLIEFLRRIRIKLAPPNSRRERLWYFLLRFSGMRDI